MKTKTAPLRRAAIPPNYNCAICDAEWPDHLMVTRIVRKETQHICCPCNGKIKAEAATKLARSSLGRYTIGKSMAPTFGVMGWIVLALVVVGGALYGATFLVSSYRAKEKEGISVFGPKKMEGMLVTSQLPLKSGVTIEGSAFFVQGPTGPMAVLPPILLPAPTVRKHSPEVPLFDKWTFTTINEPRKVVKATRLHENPATNALWLVECQAGADPKTFPVDVLEPQLKPVTAGFRVRMLRLMTANGKPTQVTSEARVEAAFAGGANISVALATPLPPGGLVGSPLVSEAGDLVGVVVGLGEQPDAQGNVGYVEAISGVDLLGMRPSPPKPASDKKAIPAGAKPKKAKTSIIPGGNPYDRPEYDDLK